MEVAKEEAGAVLKAAGVELREAVCGGLAQGAALSEGQQCAIRCSSVADLQHLIEDVPGRYSANAHASISSNGAGLRKHGVSVTCSMDANGFRWWVTRESGTVGTPCSADAGCWYCSGTHGRRFVRRQSYMVIQMGIESGGARWNEVVLAELSCKAVEACFLNIVPKYASICSGSDSAQQAMGMASQLNMGMFSRPESCVCSWTEGVCGHCRAATPSQRAFVAVDAFLGLFPYGEEHWLSCVTDGSESGLHCRPCGGLLNNGGVASVADSVRIAS